MGKRKNYNYTVVVEGRDRELTEKDDKVITESLRKLYNLWLEKRSKEASKN